MLRTADGSRDSCTSLPKETCRPLFFSVPFTLSPAGGDGLLLWNASASDPSRLPFFSSHFMKGVNYGA